jgi:hypothetical protein
VTKEKLEEEIASAIRSMVDMVCDRGEITGLLTEDERAEISCVAARDILSDVLSQDGAAAVVAKLVHEIKD